MPGKHITIITYFLLKVTVEQMACLRTTFPPLLPNNGNFQGHIFVIFPNPLWSCARSKFLIKVNYKRYLTKNWLSSVAVIFLINHRNFVQWKFVKWKIYIKRLYAHFVYLCTNNLPKSSHLANCRRSYPEKERCPFASSPPPSPPFSSSKAYVKRFRVFFNEIGSWYFQNVSNVYSFE